MIQITEKAFKQIHEIMMEEDTNEALRVYVQGGGCSHGRPSRAVADFKRQAGIVVFQRVNRHEISLKSIRGVRLRNIQQVRLPDGLGNVRGGIGHEISSGTVARGPVKIIAPSRVNIIGFGHHRVDTFRIRRTRTCDIAVLTGETRIPGRKVAVED